MATEPSAKLAGFLDERVERFERALFTHVDLGYILDKGVHRLDLNASVGVAPIPAVWQ